MLKISITTTPPRTPAAELHTHFTDNIPRGWPAGFFAAKEGEIVVLPAGDTPPRIHIGLGERDRLTPASLRRSLLAAMRRANSLEEKTWLLHWSLPQEFLEPALLGAAEGTYDYDTYKPAKNKKKSPPQRLEILLNPQDRTAAQRTAAQAAAIAQGTRLCRDLANAPGNALPPLALAKHLRDAVKNHPTLSIEVLDTTRLRALRMGGMLAVGGGSTNPPCLIILHHRPDKTGSAKTKSKSKTSPLVLVGKAVTFDSGGISIKPAESMEEMKYDKAGGCAVAGALLAAAQAGIQREIIGIIPAAENMPSHTAYRPGDVVTCYDGTTVEIINTDAEGRMILADALAYAAKRYQPAAMLDLATLTGACVVALGTYRAGLFCDDEKLKTALLEAAQTTGDLLWPLPHDQPYAEQIKSKIATIKNSGGRWGGASTAAAFLHHFIPEKLPWAHLDIAGVAWNSTDTPTRPQGATGYGVALLTHWLKQNEKH